MKIKRPRNIAKGWVKEPTSSIGCWISWSSAASTLSPRTPSQAPYSLTSLAVGEAIWAANLTRTILAGRNDFEFGLLVRTSVSSRG